MLMLLPVRQKAGSAATKPDNACLSLYFSSVICNLQIAETQYTELHGLSLPTQPTLCVKFRNFLLLLFLIDFEASTEISYCYPLLFFKQLLTKNCPILKLCKPLKCKSADKTFWSYQRNGENNLLSQRRFITKSHCE